MIHNTIGREVIEELFGFGFAEEGVNAVLLWPNGIDKTMILRNLAHQAALRGPHRLIHHRQRYGSLRIPT
ncbi:hypothetical protein [Pendulispora albinea]|uniref:Uncharacterized protein n=1 Tax=Pendulispora albinea TaxID=2741071 RepID=A0ABZ2LLR7_9BACT